MALPQKDTTEMEAMGRKVHGFPRACSTEKTLRQDRIDTIQLQLTGRGFRGRPLTRPRFVFLPCKNVGQSAYLANKRFPGKH